MNCARTHKEMQENQNRVAYDKLMNMKTAGISKMNDFKEELD